MALFSSSKRLRSADFTEEDIMYKARFIFGRDPYKERAPATEDRKFRALFGCSVAVAKVIWDLLNEEDLVPQGGKLIHLLWALLFVKVYPTEETLTSLCGDTTGEPERKTVRKWINLFMESISYLTDRVVSNSYDECLCSNERVSFFLCFD